MSRLSEAVGARDHAFGPSDAPVKLVEYGDYECPYCRRANREVLGVLQRAPELVRFVFRHFPLSNVHPHARLAAQAAEAAGAQGRFWEMHATLYANQDALEVEEVLGYAETLELDVDRFAEELRGGVYLPKVEHDIRTGTRSGVRGTPAFFLDGIRHDRAWDADTLTAAVEAVARQRREGGAAAPR